MKIKEKFNQKDIVVCEAAEDQLTFYYIPVGTQRRILLFIDRYSPSVLTYFREKGRSVGGGYGITMRELFCFNDYHNVKLTKVITTRIPMMVQYILKEEQQEPKAPRKKTSRIRDWDQDDRAA